MNRKPKYPSRLRQPSAADRKPINEVAIDLFNVRDLSVLPEELRQCLEGITAIEELREEWRYFLGSQWWPPRRAWANSSSRHSAVSRELTPIDHPRWNWLHSKSPSFFFSLGVCGTVATGLWNLYSAGFPNIVIAPSPLTGLYPLLCFSPALVVKWLNRKFPPKQDLYWSFNNEKGVCVLFDTEAGEYGPRDYVHVADLDIPTLEFDRQSRTIRFDDETLMSRVEKVEQQGEGRNRHTELRCTLHEGSNLEDLSLALGEIRIELERLFAEDYSAGLHVLEEKMKLFGANARAVGRSVVMSETVQELRRAMTGKRIEFCEMAEEIQHAKNGFDALLQRIDLGLTELDHLTTKQSEEDFGEQCAVKWAEIADLIRLVRHTVFMLPEELSRSLNRQGAPLQITDDSMTRAIEGVRGFDEMARTGLSSVSPVGGGSDRPGTKVLAARATKRKTLS